MGPAPDGQHTSAHVSTRQHQWQPQHSVTRPSADKSTIKGCWGPHRANVQAAATGGDDGPVARVHRAALVVVQQLTAVVNGVQCRVLNCLSLVGSPARQQQQDAEVRVPILP